MEETCINCKFYEEIRHRGMKYPKGRCLKHCAFRIHDRYEMFLTISNPGEWTCELFEQRPMPIYAMTNEGPFLLPPIVVDELLKAGWKVVSLDRSNYIKKED